MTHQIKWKTVKTTHLQTRLHFLNWTLLNWIIPGFLTKENLLHPNFQNLTVEQNKCSPWSQDKSMFSFKQKITSVHGPLCWIWATLYMEKEPMEDSGENFYFCSRTPVLKMGCPINGKNLWKIVGKIFTKALGWNISVLIF